MGNVDARERGVLARALRVARDPARAWAEVLRRLGLREPLASAGVGPPEPPWQETLLRAYAGRCAELGIDDLYLVLSFDCDRDVDYEVAEELENALGASGVCATYAVPGSQLRRGAAVYRRMAERGAEFMNHGGRPHAELRDGLFASVNFYDEVSEEEVVEDIHLGHRTVCEVIGRPPRGFRAPHFGRFQAPEQLSVVYREARALGYEYCSTTIPAAAFANGPVFDVGGVFEVPVFGSYRAPNTLLDSWTYVVDRDRPKYRLTEEYFELFRETLEFFRAHRLPGVLNYYADPSHVVDQAPFLDAMSLVRRHGVRSLQFGELIARVRARAG